MPDAPQPVPLLLAAVEALVAAEREAAGIGDRWPLELEEEPAEDHDWRREYQQRNEARYWAVNRAIKYGMVWGNRGGKE